MKLLASITDTEAFAQSIAKNLTSPLSVGLIGSLGAGKTTFVRCLCNTLQIQDPVSSPTFILQNEYRGPSGMLVEHWDLYRLKELPPELEEDPDLNTIRLVEWADKFKNFYEKLDFVIIFELNGNRRTVEVRDVKKINS